jgi:hypothetical protein
MTIILGVKGYVNLGNVSISNLLSLGGSQWPNVAKKWAKFVGFQNRDFVHL